MTDQLIVKVGGSLYDWPDLGPRLMQWLARQVRRRVLLVPGGGAAADLIRTLDQTHRLGEETSHWLALRMLQVNARFLAQLLPGALVVASPHSFAATSILDAWSFAQSDENSPDRLPHTWAATSDALAIRVAQVARAPELVLLKSVAWDGADWATAMEQGIVDACFPKLARDLPMLCVRVVNLRTWQPEC